MAEQRAILIAGPTASGKSALALALAARLGGTVINADSMQVYRELRILTARPTPEAEASAPHRLYGFVPGREAYSVARFVADAARVIGECRAENRVPIIVGGTGLYFKALLEGLSPLPAVPAAIRRRWRGEAARLGPEALHTILVDRDPAMGARLKPTDTQRIVRALEVVEATGRSLADWQRTAGAPVLQQEETVKFVVTLDRDELYRRCGARLEAMLAAGALAEVESLAGLGLDRDLPVMRALGVEPLMQLLAGKMKLEAAKEQAKAETRQYAKRQLIWLRRNMSAWTSINAQELETELLRTITFIRATLDPSDHHI
jgi:tRNA dimethylallyltransferase